MAHHRPPTHGSISLRHLRWTATAFIAIAVGGLLNPVTGDLSARTGDLSAVQLPDGAEARPVALAAADFDADGMPDLLAGYATGDGGMLVLHRGNVDALYPNTPEARRRRLAGEFTASPFLPGARTFSLPAAPDFLHTGDFDADGHVDLIAAAAGGAAVVLRGNGTGLLGRAEAIALPGAVTAMAVGDINGPDGLADVVVGVTAESGSRLLVFAGYDGAWRSTPAVTDLPAPAAALALGLLDEDHVADIAAAAGTELLVIHGRERRPQTNRRQTSTPSVERRSLPFAIQSMTAAELTGDRQMDLGVVSRDGATHVLTRGTAGDLVVAKQSYASAQGPGSRHQLATGDSSVEAVAVLSMRLDGDAHDDLVMLRAGEATPTVQATLRAAASLVVVNTNDSGPGSLRQAILDANFSAGDDVITFDIPGPGPHTIVPATPLPAIRQNVTGEGGSVVIDGTSEPDYAGTPIVELSGALVGTSGTGLAIGADGCVVRGLVINRFGTGIFFSTDFGTAIGGFVEGNYIGTDVTGTLDLGNEVGIQLGLGIVSAAVQITVGGTAMAARNVVSGNDIGISLSAGGHLILGNFIGTDASGTLPLGNAGPAVSMSSAGSIEVGGLQPGARNIISGNGGPGFTFFESGPILIAGNFIGTDVSGERALGNGSHGIDAPDSELTISGNVISANAGHGIFSPTILASLDILNNRIGTNSAGTAALGNGQSGIEVNGNERLIRGNLVSGNGAHGVMMRGLENLLQQNHIGTDITGTIPLGNRGDGVQVLDIAHTIGGDGNGNVIAFNGGRGVVTPAGLFTTIGILSNAIFSNGGLGIDLADDGVTPNDACDADQEEQSGSLNRPVLTSVTSSSSETTITGQLNSLPNRSFLLQFFSSAAPDPSGFGEGAALLGSSPVTTDAACNASFTVTFPVPILPNHVVTSTATIAGSGRIPTSEFSNAIRFVPQTSEEAIRTLITEVRDLVAQGELNGLAGFVLTIKLQAALFFVERDLPGAAAVQIRGFIQIVELLVRVRQLDPAQGQALVDAAQAILAGLETS